MCQVAELRLPILKSDLASAVVSGLRPLTSALLSASRAGACSRQRFRRSNIDGRVYFIMSSPVIGFAFDANPLPRCCRATGQYRRQPEVNSSQRTRVRSPPSPRAPRSRDCKNILSTIDSWVSALSRRL